MLKEMLEIYQPIKRYNDLIGKTEGSIFDDFVYFESQKKAILEEISEFHNAKMNSKDELDAICDIIVTCFGLIHICDFNFRPIEGSTGVTAVKELERSLDMCGTLGANVACCKTITGLFNTLFYKNHYDLLGAMNEVNSSNLSKVCTTRDEIKETINKYSDAGVVIKFNGDLPESMPICYGSFDNPDQDGNFKGKDGKNYFKGKGLKSVGFKEPQLQQFIRNSK